MVLGILCPSFSSAFHSASLERSYLTYSHRQRQKSLIIVNIVDLVLKVILAVVYKWRTIPSREVNASQLSWTTCSCVMNVFICVLGMWRCFANNYLQWGAVLTWLLLNLQGFVGNSLGFSRYSNVVWYMLFVIFVPYSMLPLSLRWCIAGGFLTAISHMIYTYGFTTVPYQYPVSVRNAICEKRNDVIRMPIVLCVPQPIANALVYIVINLAGMYTKYMTDRGQRLAFIETHKAMEHKRESEKEYDRTQKLLDSSGL